MTNVLVGNDNAKSQGSWVFNDQGVAADEGFRNVSQYWLPKTITFEAGIEQIERAKMERDDVIFNAGDVDFDLDNEGKIVVGLDGQEVTPNDWSARQLCNWFNTPQTIWTAYKDGDEGDKNVILTALRNGQRKYADKPKNLLFRTYTDGTLRGVMSEKYSTVDNRWYVELLQKYIPGGRLSHWRGDADTLFGNILIPDTIRSESDSDYGGMLSISNCEIGRRVIAQTPSLFRAICMNGCIWGKIKGEVYRERHIRINMEKLAEDIRVNIESQIPLLTTKTDDLLGLHKVKAEVSMATMFAAIAKRHNFSTEVVGEFAGQWQRESNEKSAFGVYDAVTRAGQLFAPDVWVKCDEIGGELLNSGEVGWARLTNFAKSLTEKEIGKIYGIAA